MKSVEFLIIGGGPTGLGAAHRLNELGHKNWLLLEQSNRLGGLASSEIDDQGFVWDLGGHVLFSHYEYFDSLLSQLLKDEWLEHQREAWIWMRNRWIPYPFQNNLWRLPQNDLDVCVDGLRKLSEKPSQAVNRNFDDWIVNSFGTGIADVFMRPYNFKVWAYPTQDLSSGWTGERVATINTDQILQNIKSRTDQKSWGPNSVFRFPKTGGTGSIWRALGKTLPQEYIEMEREVIEINESKSIVTCRFGHQYHFKNLITTMPLPRTVQSLNVKDNYVDQISEFKWSSTHVVGIGIEGDIPEELQTKCWMYFPEENVPFYRSTVFSNYATANVPKPESQWSLMCEISESPLKRVDHETVIEETILGLKSVGILLDDAVVVSTWKKFLPFGYPTPFVGRDELLKEILPDLEERNIYSRGRFGGWKYEVSNQDHSLMQGVELVEALLLGEKEQTFYYPSEINS
ncbi:MAG: amine oxidase [Acidimicrobiaceae bacterium]|nr:amine oxidase [Acidimicrobiaceae bacterium]